MIELLKYARKIGAFNKPLYFLNNLNLIKTVERNFRIQWL